MRSGPCYEQWVSRNTYDNPYLYLRLPLELEEEWQDKGTVTWCDNGDGTYTLTPHRYGE